MEPRRVTGAVPGNKTDIRYRISPAGAETLCRGYFHDYDFFGKMNKNSPVGVHLPCLYIIIKQYVNGEGVGYEASMWYFVSCIFGTV